MGSLLDHLAPAMAQGMPCDLLAALQVDDDQKALLLADTQRGAMVTHGYGVTVAFPGDESGLVRLAGLPAAGDEIDGRSEIGPHVTPFVPLVTLPGRLARGAVGPEVGRSVQPLGHVGLQLSPIGKTLPGQRVALDIADPGLHLALAFGVVPLAGPDPETGSSGVAVKLVVEGQLPVALFDHHQPGLVVDALLGAPAEIPKRRVMHADKHAGVDGAGRDPHVHQPGIGEDEDHEINCRRPASHQHPAELAWVHLALDSRDHVQDRLVIAFLLERGCLFEPGHVPSHRPDRYRLVRILLFEFTVNFNRAQSRERLHEMPDVVPVRIQELAPLTVALTRLDLLFGHGQILPDRIAGNPEMPGNAPDGHARTLTV